MGPIRPGPSRPHGAEGLLTGALIDAYLASFGGNQSAAAKYAQIPWGTLDNIRQGIPHNHSSRHGWAAADRLQQAIQRRLSRKRYRELTEEPMKTPQLIALANDGTGIPTVLNLSPRSGDLLIGQPPIFTSKVCERCQQPKSYDAFGLNAASQDGYQKWCKSCRKRKEEPVVTTPTVQVHDTITAVAATGEDAVLHYLDVVEKDVKNLRRAISPLRGSARDLRELDTAYRILLGQNATLLVQLDQTLADQGEIWSLAGTGTDSALAEENAALHTKVGDQARQIAALLREVDRLRKGAE